MFLSVGETIVLGLLLVENVVNNPEFHKDTLVTHYLIKERTFFSKSNICIFSLYRDSYFFGGNKRTRYRTPIISNRTVIFFTGCTDL